MAVAAALLLLAGVSIVVLWPGYALYDSVGQFREALSGQYEDWHPPIMARLWALLHQWFGGSTGPMLALQLGLYWLGFALVADALIAARRWVAASGVLLLACSPLLLGWQAVILKDSQMLGALLAAVGLVASRRLRARPLTIPQTLLFVVLMTYAILVRANAMFAVVPLAVLLSPRPTGLLRKILAIILLSIGAIAIAPAINHRLLGASPSGVEKTQPLYDLAAIGVAEPPGSPFTPSELTTIRSRHCVKPFFWDPLGDEAACGSQVRRLQQEESGTLYRLWARAIIDHPLAYARHRLAHWNSTERWLVPLGLIGAEPPAEDETNDNGLVAPTSTAAVAIQHAGAMEARTPLGWPIAWTFVSLLIAISAWSRRNEPSAELALALALSAIGIEASFLVVSIASDLRYHLWSMTASALALILLAEGTVVSRGVKLATLAVGVIIAAGLYTRSTLPPAPGTYRAMIDARTG